MKKICVIICLIFSASFMYAQEAKVVNGPEIKLEKLFFDFGELKVGDVKEVTLSFINTGNKPLILDNVISSCDCTTVDWSKAPVMPGKSAKITATYSADHTGIISKRVTVLSNANTDRVILQLKGNVN